MEQPPIDFLEILEQRRMAAKVSERNGHIRQPGEDDSTTAPVPPLFLPLPDFFALCHEHIEYLLEPYIVKGGFLLVSAAPKAGKTFFAAWLATEVADHGGRVLFVEEEGPRETMRDRFSPFLSQTLDKYKGKLWVAHRKGIHLDDQRWISKIVADSNAVNATLVVLDPAFELHSGARPENEALQLIAQAIKRIIDETGAAVVLVHHNKKGESWDKSSNAEAQSADVRSTGALAGAADNIVMLKSVPRSERRPGELRFYIENPDTRIGEPFERRLAVVTMGGTSGSQASISFREPELQDAATLRELLKHVPEQPDAISQADLIQAGKIGSYRGRSAIVFGLRTGALVRVQGRNGGLQRGISRTSPPNKSRTALMTDRGLDSLERVRDQSASVPDSKTASEPLNPTSTASDHVQTMDREST
jgi:hypothetical protein